MGLERIIANTGSIISRHAPAILTGIGVAGVLGTTIAAVKATPQAFIDIQNAQSEQTARLTKIEMVRLTWRYYIPAATIGALTVGAIISSQVTNQRRQAVLASSYALTETALREYKEKVIETIGEEKDTAIRDEIAKEHLMAVPMVNSEVLSTGNGDYLCFDSLSARYFRCSIETIRKAVNDVNYQCIHEMNASVNEFYAMLGLPPAGFGEEVGWRHDNLMEVHFSYHGNENAEPVLSIEYLTAPIRGYYKING